MKKYYKLLSNRLLTMCVIYVIFFTIISYSISLIYTMNIHNKNEQKRAEQLTDVINSALSHSINITQALSTNIATISYTQGDYNDMYSNYSNIRDIQVQISNIVSNIVQQNISPKYLTIVDPSENRVIHSNGTTPLDYFIKEHNINCDTLPETLSNLQSINKTTYTLELSLSAEANSYLISCISYKTQSEKPVVFMVLYDFKTLFASIPKSNLECIMEVNIDKSSIHFAYDEVSGLPAKIPEKNNFKYKLISQSEINSFYWKSIICSFHTPYIPYFLRLNSFMLLLILVIVGLFFIGVIYARKNAEKMYRPIQKILTSLPMDSIQNATGEFEALESHLSALTSQKRIMSDIISSNKKQLSEKFLLQLITSAMPKIQLRDGMTTYGFNDSVLPLQVFILTYRNAVELMDILSIDGLNEVRISIHDFFNSAYNQNSEHDRTDFFRLLDIDQQTMVILSHVDGSENFTQSLKKNILTIEMLFDIDLVAFAGNIAASWDELPSSYSSALHLKNNLMHASDQKIIIFSEDTKTGQLIEYPSETESKLISSVLSGNLNSAVETINYIVDNNMNKTILTHGNYSLFITMVYSSFIKILSQINKTESQIFGDIKIYLELAGCSDAESLKLTLTGIISKIISNIQDTQKHITDSVTSRMLTYIHENYACDISLFSLAEHLNLSHSYASRFFKAQTGENFKDYLTNFRMEKAIELMKTSPDMKMVDIASAVGCTPKTFARIFTKKYGTAPSNYLQLPKNNNHR